MSTYGTRDRILRLRIAHYKTEDKTEAEAHKFGTLFAEKAAHLHEKHGIWGYAQVKFLPPLPSGPKMSRTELFSVGLHPREDPQGRRSHESEGEPGLGNRRS